MLLSDKWTQYKVLGCGDGEKVEYWNGYVLRRPDPQALWPMTGLHGESRVDAHYHRSKSGGGEWEIKTNIPKSWVMDYEGLRFKIEPTGFKHTGLFPEQAVNWDWMSAKIQNAGRPINVLNLFAYTGGATCACLKAGAAVCHVDASKGMVNWARENVSLSGLEDKPVRYIVEDCMKFVQREIRRGKTYDAVIMDPPSYGRGPGGEVWKLEEELYGLVEILSHVLSPNPLFFLLNSYTTGLSPSVTGNMLTLALASFKGRVVSGEVGLPVEGTSVVLPCGTYARWED